MRAAGKVLLPACIDAPQTPGSILRPAYGFVTSQSTIRVCVVWCGADECHPGLNRELEGGCAHMGPEAERGARG